MSWADWAGLIVSVLSIVGAFVMTIQWLVRHYLNELKPNGGGSIKDKVNSLEEKVDFLTDLVKEVLKK